MDVWVHNAGIGAKTSTFTPDETWQRMWQVHVMAIVYASRSLLPRWTLRGVHDELVPGVGAVP